MGARELAALLDAVAQAEAALARAVLLAGRLAGSGVAERVEGLPLEMLLGLQARMTGADRRTLVAAGEALRGMPVFARLFAEGRVSWGQVRGIVAAVRRLPADARAEVDAYLAATATEHSGVDVFTPEGLVDAVSAVVDEMRGARAVERAERRRDDGSFLAVQGGLDGRTRLYGELGPILAAGVLTTLDAAAGPPTPADPGDSPWGRHAAPGDGRPAGGWTGTTRGRQYARALGRVCAEWLGSGGTSRDPGTRDRRGVDGGGGHDADSSSPSCDGSDEGGVLGTDPGLHDGGSGDGSGGWRSGGRGRRRRAARPLLVAHVDLTTATAATAGTVELPVRGLLPRITAAAVEALARSADVQAVLFDGARPLAVTGKVDAAAIPAHTRIAVRARDRGCRFPGSTDPLAHSDLHHLTPRAAGGDHHPDNLAALSRRHHTLVHRHGWQLTLHPSSGQVTANRGTRSYRSLPRGTPLTRPSTAAARRHPPAPVERDGEPPTPSRPLDPPPADPLPF